MLNILVCIKQVPDTTEIRIDPVTNTLIRAGVPSIVNPFDAYALEMAVSLKESCGGKVTVVSMGPPQAKEALKECLSKGADEAFLMTDRVVGGSDTLATSYILSCVAKHLGPFDLIFCGKQAIDGDTGQVGPEMARHLDIPQITYATRIEAEDGMVRVTREVEDGWEVITAEFPVLVTVNKTEKEPRMATLRGRMAANRAVIGEIHAADLPEMDLSRVGLNGSPTKVKKTFCPEHTKNGMILSGKGAPEAARELVHTLVAAGLIH